MPRDRRLYITIPIDFDEHPKTVALSDAAVRTFLEMNIYSRRNGTDGLITTQAARRWKSRAIKELVDSHPERPLVVVTEDGYLIRDYAQHQFTTADLAKLRTARAEAGKRGGEAKAKALASARDLPQQKGKQILPESESESESKQIDDADAGPESHVADARALGIKDLSRLRISIEKVVGPISSLFGDAFVIDVTRLVLDRSTRHVDAVEAYVDRACQQSPEVIAALWAEVISDAPEEAAS